MDVNLVAPALCGIGAVGMFITAALVRRTEDAEHRGAIVVLGMILAVIAAMYLATPLVTR
jgi:hypothetical protein